MEKLLDQSKSFQFLWASGLFCFVLGAAMPILNAADLKGANSSMERPSKVGEKESSEADPGMPREQVLSPSRKPSVPLADEVDTSFAGNRSPSLPLNSLSVQVPRLKPTGIVNQWKVVEDPSGKFKKDQLINCDEFGNCSAAH